MWFRRRRFILYFFSNCKSSFFNPGAWLAGVIKSHMIDPRGIISWIYVKLKITMLLTRYTTLSSCSFKSRICLHVFPHYKTMEDDDAHGAGPVWIGGARLAGYIIHCLRHCYHQNMEALALWFRRRRGAFYVFFSIVSL